MAAPVVAGGLGGGSGVLRADADGALRATRADAARARERRREQRVVPQGRVPDGPRRSLARDARSEPRAQRGVRAFAGHMRNVRLHRRFDCVFVHDAISYLTTEADLRQAIETAFVHCEPGGAALFAPDLVRENFRASTDHGGHDGADRSLRYLEWTWDPDPDPAHGGRLRGAQRPVRALRSAGRPRGVRGAQASRLSRGVLDQMRPRTESLRESGLDSRSWRQPR